MGRRCCLLCRHDQHPPGICLETSSCWNIPKIQQLHEHDIHFFCVQIYPDRQAEADSCWSSKTSASSLLNIHALSLFSTGQMLPVRQSGHDWCSAWHGWLAIIRRAHNVATVCRQVRWGQEKLFFNIRYCFTQILSHLNHIIILPQVLYLISYSYAH